MTGDHQRLTDPSVLRAYSHPVRLAIVDVLRLERSATATRCAEVTGQSVASCSYHLSILAKYGLVEPADGGQGREKPWRMVHDGQSWSLEDDMEPETAVAVETLGEVFVDHVASRMKDWIRRSGRESEAWRRAGNWATTAWLTEDELAALMAEFEEICRRYDDRRLDPSSAPPGSRPVELFLASWLPRPPDHAAGAS